MTANAQQMLQVLSRLESRMDSMGDKGARGGRRAAGGLQAASSQAVQLAGALTGVGSVIGGILTAVQTIRAEHDQIVARARAAEARTRTQGEAVRRTRVAFTDDDTLKSGDLESTIARVAKETRSSQQVVAAALENAFSAKGSLSNQVAVEAVTQALRLLPGDLEAGTTLSGRALDIAKLTGGNDLAANLGFIQNVQQASRVVGLQKVGQNLVPAVAASTQFGGSAEFGAELFAATTQLTGDEEGRVSSTGVINLIKQLSEFAPTRKDRFEDKEGKFRVGAEDLTALEGATSPEARLALLQQSPELRRAFLSKASFEAKNTAAFRAIISGEGSALEQLGKAQGAIEDPVQAQAQLRGLFESKISELERGKFQKAVTVGQQLEGIEEAAELRPDQAREAQARRAVELAFDKINLAGIDSLQRGVSTSRFEFDVGRGVDPAEAALFQLRNLRQAPDVVGTRGGRNIPGISKSFDQAAVDTLDKLIAVMEKQLAEAEKTAKAGQEQATEQKRGNLRKQSGPPPAARTDRRNQPPR